MLKCMDGDTLIFCVASIFVKFVEKVRRYEILRHTEESGHAGTGNVRINLKVRGVPTGL